jgi:hypothetical protein
VKAANVAWRLTLAGLLIMLAVCVWRVTRTLEELPKALDARLAAEADATREAARAEIFTTRAALVEELRALRRDAIAELARAITLADWRLASIEERAERQTAATRAEAAAQLEGLRGELAAVREDISDTLNHVNGLLADTDRAVELLTPQALGLVAAAKVTAGETAQAMRAIEREVPIIVGNVRQTTANVAQATKPSRWYVRVARILAPVLGGWVIGKVQ